MLGEGWGWILRIDEEGKWLPDCTTLTFVSTSFVFMRIQTFLDHAENQYYGCEKSVAVRLCGHMWLTSMSWYCVGVLWGDWGWEGHNATLSISRREIPLSVFFLFNGQNQKNFISVTRFEGYPWVSVTYFENDKSISRNKFIWQNLMCHGLVLCESGFELKVLWQKGANQDACRNNDSWSRVHPQMLPQLTPACACDI